MGIFDKLRGKKSEDVIDSTRKMSVEEDYNRIYNEIENEFVDSFNQAEKEADDMERRLNNYDNSSSRRKIDDHLSNFAKDLNIEINQEKQLKKTNSEDIYKQLGIMSKSEFSKALSKKNEKEEKVSTEKPVPKKQVNINLDNFDLDALSNFKPPVFDDKDEKVVQSSYIDRVLEKLNLSEFKSSPAADYINKLLKLDSIRDEASFEKLLATTSSTSVKDKMSLNYDIRKIDDNLVIFVYEKEGDEVWHKNYEEVRFYSNDTKVETSRRYVIRDRNSVELSKFDLIRVGTDKALVSYEEVLDDSKNVKSFIDLSKFVNNNDSRTLDNDFLFEDSKKNMIRLLAVEQNKDKFNFSEYQSPDKTIDDIYRK